MRVTTDFPKTAEPGAATERHEFAMPREIIRANSVAEVVDALQRVATAAAAGYWAAGFISYEAAPAFEPAMHVFKPGAMPLLQFGVFDAPHPVHVTAPVARAGTHAERVQPAWSEQTSEEEFRSAIDRIHEAIAAGETYQVNYTNRLHATFVGDAFDWYEQLIALQGSGWHAYIETDEHAILSASPELFFEKRGDRISTRPMKGTRPRGRWLQEDQELERELTSSAKDRAENLMIVDLLRNDLGRVARTGTVHVPALFTAERYRTVWQLTSRIEAVLRDDASLVDIFRALFPCGSVTGAPKISTMKWIHEIEATPRGVYCGAIGVVRPGGDCTFSVPIRTVQLDKKTGHGVYGVGSGITIDSIADDELAESRAKAAFLNADAPEFELLETVRAESGVILRMDRHITRMRESGLFFSGYRMDEERITQALHEAADACHVPCRIRLRIRIDGAFTIETSTTPAYYADPDACRNAEARQTVTLADAPVDSSNVFLCNKTTHRTMYEKARLQMDDAFDVLLWNEAGHITEFTTGNVIVQIAGTLITPPQADGLLGGTFRAELIAAGVVQEDRIRRDDLDRCERMWLVNSLRGWIEARLTQRA